MENGVRGLVKEASPTLVHEKVVGREEVHAEDGLIHVRHYENSGEAADRSVVKLEGPGTIDGDRSLASLQGVVSHARLGTGLHISGRHNTHLSP